MSSPPGPPAAAPAVSPGDVIRIGATPAVVCTLHGADEVEVIYRDARHHVIAEDAVWRDGIWTFKAPGLSAGWFADKKPRLQPYVEILEAFHKPPVRDFMSRLKQKSKR